MPTQAIKDQTAIVGIGWSAFTKSSETSTLNLAAEASIKAIDDAGLSPADIDGVVTYTHGLLSEVKLYPRELIHALALENCRFDAFGNLGGSHNCATVATAAMAVFSGLCKNVLVYYARRGGSARDRTGRDRAAGPLPGFRLWELAYGSNHAAANFGRHVVAHMARYGTNSLDMAHVAVTTREHAVLNTKAVMRTPLTVEQHQESPLIVYPFHLFDCCLQTDGAVAMIVTSAERARDLRQPPVYIMSIAGGVEEGAAEWETAAERTAPQLYEGAGITVEDVDFAELYDPFTGMCLLHMEGFGLAEPGEGAAMVRAGETRLDGSMPINTHGGLLSEGHIHGMNTILEAVQQLRPGGVVDDLCEGRHTFDRSRCRQVRSPEIGLVCGEMGASALLLRSA